MEVRPGRDSDPLCSSCGDDGHDGDGSDQGRKRRKQGLLHSQEAETSANEGYRHAHTQLTEATSFTGLNSPPSWLSAAARPGSLPTSPWLCFHSH